MSAHTRAVGAAMTADDTMTAADVRRMEAEAHERVGRLVERLGKLPAGFPIGDNPNDAATMLVVGADEAEIATRAALFREQYRATLKPIAAKSLGSDEQLARLREAARAEHARCYGSRPGFVAPISDRCSGACATAHDEIRAFQFNAHPAAKARAELHRLAVPYDHKARESVARAAMHAARGALKDAKWRLSCLSDSLEGVTRGAGGTRLNVTTYTNLVARLTADLAQAEKVHQALVAERERLCAQVDDELRGATVEAPAKRSKARAS